MTKRNRSILLAKLKLWRDGTELVGYLLPVEINYLISLGCKATSTLWKMDDVEQQIKIGCCCPTWFYLKPNKDILEEVRERNKDWKRHGQ